MYNYYTRYYFHIYDVFTKEHIQERSRSSNCSFNLRTAGLVWFECYNFSGNLKLMFTFKQHIISTLHKPKCAVRVSLMLPLMCSNHGYNNIHHMHIKDDDNDKTVKNNNYSTNSNKTLEIFKLKETYV